MVTQHAIKQKLWPGLVVRGWIAHLLANSEGYVLIRPMTLA
jgi:hypothetical protein